MRTDNLTKLQEWEQQELERAYDEAISLAIRKAVVNNPEMGAFTTPAVIEHNEMAMLAWGIQHLPNNGHPEDATFWELCFNAVGSSLTRDPHYTSFETRRALFNSFVERLPSRTRQAIYQGDTSFLDADQQETLQNIGGVPQFVHFCNEGDFNA